MRACLVTVRNERFDIKDRNRTDTNDVNIAYLLGATEHFWCGERDLELFSSYDLIMFTMSKIKENYENSWMELVKLLRDKYGDSKKIVMYQEAEVDWVLDKSHSIEDQIELFKVISYLDMFMCHNEADMGLFKYCVPYTKVIYVPTPLPIKTIEQWKIPVERKREEKQLEIIFGSSFDQRAYGLFGYAVAMELKRKFKDRVKLTRYERSIWNDNRTEKIKNYFGVEFESLPTMGWIEWIKRLSKSYLSMNLMPAAAAGRDAIVFSALGIPHIGNMRLEILKKHTDVDILDLEQILFACERLLEDNQHYDSVSSLMVERAWYYHSFEKVKRHLITEFAGIGVDI